MPIQSKGGYDLDFDNLDAIDPFQGSNKMILSPARPSVEDCPTHPTEPQHPQPENIFEEPTKIESALDETLPFSQSVENSLFDLSTNISSTESSVVTVVKVEEPDSYTAKPDEKECAKISLSVDEDKVTDGFAEDAPLPVKGSYALDFDNLDAFNPFQTGGSKVQNSPVPGIKVSDNNPPVEVQIKESKTTHVDTPKVAQEVAVQRDPKPMATVAPISANAAKPTAAESEPSISQVKGGPVKLEFNFDYDGEVKQKPLPKKFGKGPPGLKSKSGKLSSDVKPPKETPVKPDTSDAADVPGPQGSYSFDFDKYDDPNFNPFSTKSSMNNSPECSNKSIPVVVEASIPKPTEKPLEKEDASPVWCVNLSI